jgi:predicted nucleic acid-binding Zn ribbon protein
MAIIREKTGFGRENIPSRNLNSPGGKLFFQLIARNPHGVCVGNKENPPRTVFRLKQTGYFLINIRPRNERFCPAANRQALGKFRHRKPFFHKLIYFVLIFVFIIYVCMINS